MNSDRDDELTVALDAARLAHHVAYAEARWRVLDHLPPGPPDLASMEDGPRRVVQRWQAAEAEYDRLRLAAYERVRQRGAEPAQQRSREDDAPTPRAR